MIVLEDLNNQINYHFGVSKIDLNFSDEFLIDMNNLNIFSGKTKWKDLELEDWQLLISKNILQFIQNQKNDEIKNSLMFLLNGLYTCLSKNKNIAPQDIKILYYSDRNFKFSYTMESFVAEKSSFLRILK